MNDNYEPLCDLPVVAHGLKRLQIEIDTRYCANNFICLRDLDLRIQEIISLYIDHTRIKPDTPLLSIIIYDDHRWLMKLERGLGFAMYGRIGKRWSYIETYTGNALTLLEHAQARGLLNVVYIPDGCGYFHW